MAKNLEKRASLMAQLVKNPPAMWETWVWSLGWEDPQEKGKATHSSILEKKSSICSCLLIFLEKEMATHSSILAWRITWTEEPGVLQSMGSQRVGYDWATSLLIFLGVWGQREFWNCFSFQCYFLTWLYQVKISKPGGEWSFWCCFPNHSGISFGNGNEAVDYFFF